MQKTVGRIKGFENREMIQGPYPYLMDPRMKKALEKVAEKEFFSISGILKKQQMSISTRTSLTGERKSQVTNLEPDETKRVEVQPVEYPKCKLTVMVRPEDKV